MKYVYLLVGHINYEGCETIGGFTSLVGAKKHFKNMEFTEIYDAVTVERWLLNSDKYEYKCHLKGGSKSK